MGTVQPINLEACQRCLEIIEYSPQDVLVPYSLRRQLWDDDGAPVPLPFPERAYVDTNCGNGGVYGLCIKFSVRECAFGVG